MQESKFIITEDEKTILKRLIEQNYYYVLSEIDD